LRFQRYVFNAHVRSVLRAKPPLERVCAATGGCVMCEPSDGGAGDPRTNRMTTPLASARACAPFFRGQVDDE
jgi:hypothetical protein